jgi:hypothetical protein
MFISSYYEYSRNKKDGYYILETRRTAVNSVIVLVVLFAIGVDKVACNFSS